MKKVFMLAIAALAIAAAWVLDADNREQDRLRIERPCDVRTNKPYVCQHGAKSEDFRRAPNDYRGI